MRCGRRSGWSRSSWTSSTPMTCRRSTGSSPRTPSARSWASTRPGCTTSRCPPRSRSRRRPRRRSPTSRRSTTPMPARPAQAGAVERERVLEALSTVRDPELDEPITTLGFVEGLEIGPGVVRARLRLPTFFCAPNFAFLMVADARAAVRKAVGDGVEVHVRLVDHSNSDEINDGVEQGGGFEGTFGDEAGGELEELRALFWGKSL